MYAEDNCRERKRYVCVVEDHSVETQLRLAVELYVQRSYLR